MSSYSFRRKFQGSNQYPSRNRSTTCVELQTPQSYREYALFRGIYSAASRGTRRPSAAAQQQSRPRLILNVRQNCATASFARSRVTSRNLDILQMCDTAITSTPVPLPSRLAVLAARDAKPVYLGLEEEVRDTLRAAALGNISSYCASG